MPTTQSSGSPPHSAMNCSSTGYRSKWALLAKCGCEAVESPPAPCRVTGPAEPFKALHKAHRRSTAATSETITPGGTIESPQHHDETPRHQVFKRETRKTKKRGQHQETPTNENQ